MSLLLCDHHSWLKMLPYVCPILGLKKADAGSCPVPVRQGRGGSKVHAASALRGFCLAVTRSSWAHLPVTEHVALPRPSSHRPGSVLPSAGKADWNSWRIFLTTAGFTMGSSPGNPPSLHLPPLSPSLLSFSSLLPSFDL